MDLITLIGTLESNLTREIVSTIHGSTVSYTASTTKTVTINTSTAYSNVNRLCLISKNNTTYMYITSYEFKKTVKVSLADITSISIS